MVSAGQPHKIANNIAYLEYPISNTLVWHVDHETYPLVGFELCK